MVWGITIFFSGPTQRPKYLYISQLILFNKYSTNCDKVTQLTLHKLTHPCMAMHSQNITKSNKFAKLLFNHHHPCCFCPYVSNSMVHYIICDVLMLPCIWWWAAQTKWFIMRGKPGCVMAHNLLKFLNLCKIRGM